MNDAVRPENPAGAPPARPRRVLAASALGVVGGMGTAGGMWLPLATLGGLGSVGFFDYNHVRVYACVGAASLVVVFSVARRFRIVLLAAGVLCGLLLATGIDLYQALHDAMSMDGGSDLARMAKQMVAHSALQSGAYLVPFCVAASVAAGVVGSATVPVRAASATNGS